MVILLIVWLIATFTLVGIDLRTRLAGETRGRVSAVIRLFAIDLVAVSGFWFSR